MLALFDSKEVQDMYGESKKEEGRQEGRQEGLQEGLREGIFEGKIKTLWGLVKKNRLTREEAAEEAGMSLTEFNRQVSVILAEPAADYNAS